jgi:curved DNA-binding protein CbpA
VKKLPAYTLKTKRLTPEAQAVLRTLQQAQEPDELLFTSLPQACGLPPIGTDEADDSEADAAEGEYATTAKILRKKLVQALQEIQTAYDRLLSETKSRLHDAFGVRSDETNLRKDLGVRASYLLGQCVERTLKSFTEEAVDETKTDAEWLEALVRIVADKPAESWTDEDVTGFEIKLSDLARRFKNLEALQKEVAAKGSQGFEARKITVTRPDGEETNQMVWFDNEQKDRIDGLLEEILGTLSKYDSQLQQAVVAKLTERVLGSAPQDNLAQIRDKRQDQEYEQEKSQTHSRSIGRQG